MTFFGRLSIGSQCLRTLQTMIEQQRSVFKAKKHLDKEFASKFLLPVDTDFQMWLKQCRIARTAAMPTTPSSILHIWYLRSFLDPSTSPSLQPSRLKPPSTIQLRTMTQKRMTDTTTGKREKEGRRRRATKIARWFRTKPLTQICACLPTRLGQ